MRKEKKCPNNKCKEYANHRCKECFYAIPKMDNLSITTGEPILASCKFEDYLILLNGLSCKNFKQK